MPSLLMRWRLDGRVGSNCSEVAGPVAIAVGRMLARVYVMARSSGHTTQVEVGRRRGNVQNTTCDGQWEITHRVWCMSESGNGNSPSSRNSAY